MGSPHLASLLGGGGSPKTRSPNPSPGAWRCLCLSTAPGELARCHPCVCVGWGEALWTLPGPASQHRQLQPPATAGACSSYAGDRIPFTPRAREAEEDFAPGGEGATAACVTREPRLRGISHSAPRGRGAGGDPSPREWPGLSLSDTSPRQSPAGPRLPPLRLAGQRVGPR